MDIRHKAGEIYIAVWIVLLVVWLGRTQIESRITLDTVIALVALIVSVVTLLTSLSLFRKSFRPVISAAVKTHSGGNVAIHYNLVLINSGAIPAKNIVLRVDNDSLSLALGNDATPENKRRWLACFTDSAVIPSILQNDDHISCAFGSTMVDDTGFWKYGAALSITIQYEGLFGSHYQQKQELRILDSDSFTGFMWQKASI